LVKAIGGRLLLCRIPDSRQTTYRGIVVRERRLMLKRQLNFAERVAHVSDALPDLGSIPLVLFNNLGRGVVIETRVVDGVETLGYTTKQKEELSHRLDLRCEQCARGLDLGRLFLCGRGGSGRR